MWSRSAIHASGIVVCERNSQAGSIFLGSPLRRARKSASLQPIRFNPSTTRRSACTASASCTASPKWLGPGAVSTCARQKEITVAAPIHNQRLIPAAKQMPKFLVPPIIPAGVGAQQSLHPGHQFGLGRFDYQVNVVAHQADQWLATILPRPRRGGEGRGEGVRPVYSPSPRSARLGRTIPKPKPPVYPLYSPSKPIVIPFYVKYRGITGGLQWV